jgi:hypothetical protein
MHRFSKIRRYLDIEIMGYGRRGTMTWTIIIIES